MISRFLEEHPSVVWMEAEDTGIRFPVLVTDAFIHLANMAGEVLSQTGKKAIGTDEFKACRQNGLVYVASDNDDSSIPLLFGDYRLLAAGEGSIGAVLVRRIRAFNGSPTIYTPKGYANMLAEEREDHRTFLEGSRFTNCVICNDAPPVYVVFPYIARTYMSEVPAGDLLFADSEDFREAQKHGMYAIRIDDVPIAIGSVDLFIGMLSVMSLFQPAYRERATFSRLTRIVN